LTPEARRALEREIGPLGAGASAGAESMTPNRIQAARGLSAAVQAQAQSFFRLEGNWITQADQLLLNRTFYRLSDTLTDEARRYLEGVVGPLRPSVYSVEREVLHGG
jgi:hypothetical protein